LVAQLIVRLIFYFVPVSIMTLLIRMLTRFEPAAARTTAHFLKSKHGVRQALYVPSFPILASSLIKTRD